MPLRPEEDEDNAGGHYVTAGVAIAGLGVFGMLIATIIHTTVKVDLGFINVRAMAMVCTLFIALGTWMIRSGNRQRSEP